MTSVQLAAADLRSLCESVQVAQMNAARGLLRELASSVANAGDMLRGLPEDLRAGRADTYTRQIVGTAAPGLHQIHRLGNAGPGVAVSLHIYGVDQADLCTGVNHLVPTPAPH